MKESTLDICSTCNYGTTCVRRAHHGQPVWQCEEFDDYQPVASGFTIGEVIGVEETVYDESKGICCNCKDHDSCSTPNAQKSIWHCEEYSY